jgi:hypothetical protein
MKEAIEFKWLPALMGRRPTLAMVGGPPPEVAPIKDIRDTESLLSVDTDEISFEKSNKAQSLLSAPKDLTQRDTLLRKNENRVSHSPEKVLKGERSSSEVMARESIAGREDPEVVKEVLSRSFKTLFESCTETEIPDSPIPGPDMQQTDTNNESMTLSVEDDHHEPSGERPESPIPLVFSQDGEDDDVPQYSEENKRLELLGATEDNPIVIDDYRCEEMEDSPATDREIIEDSETTIERLPPTDGEERDAPPRSPSLDLLASQEQSSFDYRPIERSAYGNRLAFSQSLLYSMRSRNRDIDSLLKELPTEYTFGNQNNENKSMASSLLKSFSEHTKETYTPKISNLSLQTSIDSSVGLPPSIDNSSVAQGTTPSVQSSNRRFKLISFKKIPDRSADDHMIATRINQKNDFVGESDQSRELSFLTPRFQPKLNI